MSDDDFSAPLQDLWIPFLHRAPSNLGLFMELEQTRRVTQRMWSSRMITTIQVWSLKTGFLCLSFKVLVYKGRTSPVLAVVASSIFIVFSISEL